MSNIINKQQALNEIISKHIANLNVKERYLLKMMKRIDPSNRPEEELLALLYITHLEEPDISDDRQVEISDRLEELLKYSDNKQLDGIRKQFC